VFAYLLFTHSYLLHLSNKILHFPQKRIHWINQKKKIGIAESIPKLVNRRPFDFFLLVKMVEGKEGSVGRVNALNVYVMRDNLDGAEFFPADTPYS
jgi:hypothetical protein